jgi:hypothetical protein
MSTTTIQTVATTQLDPRDVATIHAALLSYQFHRATGSLPDEVHDAATADGEHEPLDHLETNELIDLIQAGDLIKIHTQGHDWEETSTDIGLALEGHEAARRDQVGAIIGILGALGAAEHSASGTLPC